MALVAGGAALAIAASGCVPTAAQGVMTGPAAPPEPQINPILRWPRRSASGSWFSSRLSCWACGAAGCGGAGMEGATDVNAPELPDHMVPSNSARSAAW